MGYESPEPVDLVEFVIDGRIIALPPIEKRILACGGCIEVVRAAYHHYSGVVINEGLNNAVGMEQVDDRQDISVCPHVVVPMEAHSARC
jgi:hypothetical protein